MTNKILVEIGFIVMKIPVYSKTAGNSTKTQNYCAIYGFLPSCLYFFILTILTKKNITQFHCKQDRIAAACLPTGMSEADYRF